MADNDPARSAVMAKRELKKIQKKLKGAKGDELAELKQKEAELLALVEQGDAPSGAPTGDSTKPAAEAPHGGAELKSNPETGATSSGPVLTSDTNPALAEIQRCRGELLELRNRQLTLSYGSVEYNKNSASVTALAKEVEKKMDTVTKAYRATQRDLDLKREELKRYEAASEARAGVDMADLQASVAATEKEEQLQLEVLNFELDAKKKELSESQVAQQNLTANLDAVQGREPKLRKEIATLEDLVGGNSNSKEERECLRHLVQDAIHSNSAADGLGMRSGGPGGPISVIHPRVAEVAVLIEEMQIVGGNARMQATISAFRELLKSTTVLELKSLREIDTVAFVKLIEANFDFLRRKREASAGMRYAKEALIRRLIALIRLDTESSQDTSVSAAFRDRRDSVRNRDPRDVALEVLENISGEVRNALTNIVEYRSLPFVNNTDTILVFGRSSTIELILLARGRDPQRRPKKVIVIDAAPLHEGRELATKLSEIGVNVTYALLTACCTVMPQCTRVFIGASAVLQNGDVFGRCGTALVAACAKAFRKPVLCFSESYKFVAEVWLGNLAQNTKLLDIRSTAGTSQQMSPVPQSEMLGFPSAEGRSPVGRANWTKGSSFEDHDTHSHRSSVASISASGYLYDLTPAAYVDMIIWELGYLHTSAIVSAIKSIEQRDEVL